MTDYVSDVMGANVPAVDASQAGDTKVVPFSISLTAATTYAADDKFIFAKLPAEHVLVDMFFAYSDFDSGTALELNGGIFKNDASYTAVDNDCWLSAGTIMQASGRFHLLDDSDEDEWMEVYSEVEERVVGLEVETAPSGNPNASKRIWGWIQYRPAFYTD